MGMAASQARLLGLQARQSNLEYQGQQINQERTILSQQCTELYNSLLDMNVPTPPSTQDYTTVQYTGASGTIKYSFEPNDVKPGANNTYTVILTHTEFTNSLEKNSGYKTTSKGNKTINASAIAENVTGLTASQLRNYYREGGIPLSPNDTDIVEQDPTTGKYTIKCVEGTPIYSEDAEGDINLQIQGGGYTIGGFQAYELDEKIIADENLYEGYEEAIKNYGLKKSDGEPYEPKDFFVYFDDKGRTHFALQVDVKKATQEQDNTCLTYDYLLNGEVEKSEPFEDSMIKFDPSSGRITSIDIPSSRDEEGNVLSYTTINMTASTVTDELAYQDAYNKYEYAQYEYDRKQQEINAKTEIIQQQDRSLELRLQRLDNERKMITTEIEAVEKVINENIEGSYKTFNG